VLNLYRICYKKVGPMRYISHLDLLRTMERGSRRARLPLAFTQGFNPHPRISFAAPLPVGVQGEDEYMDLELESPMQAPVLVERLNTCLPYGLEILEAREVKGAAPSLMGMVEQATYAAVTIRPADINEKSLISSIKAFMEQQEVIIDKKTKKGTKAKDIRPGIVKLSGDSKEDRLFIYMTLKTGSRENVRPEEVLRALVKGYLPLNVEEFRITRTGLYAAGERTLFAEF